MTASAWLETSTCFRLLGDWLAAAEEWWYDLPGQPGLGCYGSGYNAWGVQTNQKYLSAMAVLGMLGEGQGGVGAETAALARQRALAALRFSLASHRSGALSCTDGSQWGHTWISSLGVERMMHGVYLLGPHLTAADQAALRRMILSEATWLCDELVRGKQAGCVAGKWNSSGCNVPESNLWNGALLWRAAAMYPDHPEVDRWREQAHVYLINSVSVEADADDQRVVAGKAVAERYVGPQFFDNYALDHHGYLNVGYMVICASNAAMLHFDLRLAGHPAPESLYHHQADLWEVIRRLVFSDGRLARIGGDSRVRYAYCQEYLLPSLALAADQFGDSHAGELAAGQVALIAAEAAHNRDGSFYRRRLSELCARSPYYYTRLESDRACALGQLACYATLVEPPAATVGSFEASVAGNWTELEHGAAMHRSPSRLASFSWRAYGLTQGFCLPPGESHLAEWDRNLAGRVVFLSEDGEGGGRSLLRCATRPFTGGFVTDGAVTEGVKVLLAEGWTGENRAVHQLAFLALPDDHTVIGLQHCRVGAARAYLQEVQGLHLGIPNDLYNGFTRAYLGSSGQRRCSDPPVARSREPLGSRWVAVDDLLGVVGLYGAETLELDRSPQRRGGKYHSLFVDELAWGGSLGTRSVDAGATLLDVGWLVTCHPTAVWLAATAAAATSQTDGDLRTVAVTGRDGRRYLAAWNVGDQPLSVPADELLTGEARRLDAATATLAAGEAGLWQANE